MAVALRRILVTRSPSRFVGDFRRGFSGGGARFDRFAIDFSYFRLLLWLLRELGWFFRGCGELEVAWFRVRFRVVSQFCDFQFLDS